MRRLLPYDPDVTDLTSRPGQSETAPAGADEDPWSLEALADAYAYPAEVVDAGRPWLRANMVSSLDGAARLDGLSEGLSSADDKRIFGVLRALADVVLVGAQTVRAEGYRPAMARAEFAAERAARGQGPAPVIAVVSRSLELDLTLPLFTSPRVPTVVVTAEAAPADALAATRRVADVVVAGEEHVDVGRATAALAERGWTRQLTEGGPRLLGQLAEADRLDELCLTLAPLLAAGDAPRIAHGSKSIAQRMELVGLLEAKGFLFARYARSVKIAQ
ncbi:pyrimidine reductase family protein [Streptacidiphilus neutrinimicus]|uniref:pyrimidine reductase family protein n=1 Tax=Streptacidiphilus neutrinimicus TaxID=105420 RepID=UPI0005A64704|nr:pyrimidine reductase family protein [Streptacidiphilus neutrinimicus]